MSYLFCFHHQTGWVICKWYRWGFQKSMVTVCSQTTLPCWMRNTLGNCCQTLNLGQIQKKHEVLPHKMGEIGKMTRLYWWTTAKLRKRCYICIYINIYIYTGNWNWSRKRHIFHHVQGLPNTSIACCHVKMDPQWSNKVNKHLHHLVSW